MIKEIHDGREQESNGKFRIKSYDYKKLTEAPHPGKPT